MDKGGGRWIKELGMVTEEKTAVACGSRDGGNVLAVGSLMRAELSVPCSFSIAGDDLPLFPAAGKLLCSFKTRAGLPWISEITPL